MAKKKTHETIILTNQRILDFKPHNPKGGKAKKRLYLRDAKVEGLRVMVTPAGSKSFQYYGWVKDHGPFTYTIGKVGKAELSTARDKARQINGDIALHGAKAIELIKGNGTEATIFDDLFQAYISDKKQDGTKDVKNMIQRYDSHILPTLGKKRISTITPKFIHAWHLKLLKRKKLNRIKGTISKATANHCFSLVRAVFNAKANDIPNPCASTKKFKEYSRERYLSGDELGRLFKALDECISKGAFGSDFKDLVILALSTGARKSNLLSMAWADLDLENGIWVIPATSSKNKQSMGVPLIEEAAQILSRRKELTKGIDFVFPGSGKTRHLINVSKPWGKLLKEAEITDLRFHDLRRTAGSWQAMIGSSDLIIGKSLGHKSIQSTRVYARIRDSNPIRNSMEAGFSAMLKASKEEK